MTVRTKPLELAPGDMLRPATRQHVFECAEDTAAMMRERREADLDRLRALLGCPPAIGSRSQ